MKDWINIKLVQIAKHVQSGGTPKSDNVEYYGGNIPFVSIEDMTACGKYLTKTTKSITNEGLKNSAAWLVPKDAIMYSIYATLGLPVISKIDATTNQAILNIIPNEEKIDTEFLYYYLLALRNEIYKFSSQTTQSNLNAKIVKDFDLYIPSLKSEQTRIAQILSTADKAIEQTEALIAKYQRIKTGLMQDLLTHGIDEHGNIRSKATHKFVVKNEIEVPEEWEVQQLDNALKKKEYGISVSLDDEEGTPVLRMNNLKEGEISFEDLKFSKSIEAKSLLMNRDDILFNRTNSIDYVGRTSIFKTYNEPISFASYLVRLVANKFIIPDFLNILLNFPFYQIQLKRFATIAVQQANINPTNLGKMYIAIPDKKEQQKIVELLMSNKRIINSQERNLHKLQSLKTGLMQDLLGGKVSVKTNPL